MKKKNKKIWLLVIIALILIIIVVTTMLTNSNKLTTEERKWLTDNQNTIQNINVVNNANIFGLNGKGVFYDFLTDFSTEYQIKLNQVTINVDDKESYPALTVGNSLPEGSSKLYQDHYVMIGNKEENITDLNFLNNKSIGVLTTYAEYIQKYLKDQNITWKSYENLNDLTKAIEKGETNYIIAPRMEYLDTLLTKKYWITMHLSNIPRYYYVSQGDNQYLYQILKKYFDTWQKKYLQKNIYKEERAIFTETLNISDTEIDELQKQTITHAYKTYVPYEVYGDSVYGGILGEYLNEFADFAGIDIDHNKYISDKKLNRDLNNNKITIISTFYNYANDGTNINTNLPMKAGVFAHQKNNFIINSITNLEEKTIYVEENTALLTELTSASLKIETFKLKDINKIIKKKDNIIVLDEQVGKYLQKTSLKDYDLRYSMNLNKTYSIKSFGNDTLNKLLSRYFNYLDNNLLTIKGNYNGAMIAKKGSIISSIAKYTLYGIIIISLILIMIYRSSKKVRLQKKIKKENKLKFVDHLTSLKNRNYLNENISTWNKNTIYPQSVIMIDLDRIQEINDTLGYEEGDKQIQATANILIKTQLDNTDIIRTNGNEFMIYLVGYNPKQITSYIHKLNKEFNNLPYKYGACISYSMILDDLKFIEDAINECVEDIKKQKENKKEDER